MLVVWSVFTLTTCGSDPQATARKKLEKQNINVLPHNLFKAIEIGDVQNTFLLLEAGVDINIRRHNKTPLIVAIESKKKAVVDHLLTQWVPDVKMKQSNGRTALMVAVENSNEELVVRLISLGADINATLNNGITPLMNAVLNGSHKLVDTLLKLGADPTLKNVNNDTAFSIAKKNGEVEILQLLEKFKDRLPRPN